MFDNELYNIPLGKVLEALGARPGKARNMWTSPLRSEKNASLHVDPVKNVWYDFGLSQGGTNVDLVMRVRKCSQAEAYSFLARLVPTPLRSAVKEAVEQRPAIQIKAVRAIRSNYLLQYLEGRKIPLSLAQRYLKEIIVYDPQRDLHFTLLGIPNNAGGYAMKSPSGHKGTDKAGITTINKEGKITSKPSTKKVAVFEGMFDFLSWRVMQGSELPSCDVVILNSVNNLGKAAEYLKQHDGATCFLDNDAAGERCYQGVRDLLKGKDVVDMSDLYGQFKDISEMLQASRGYSSHMNLSPSL